MISSLAYIEPGAKLGNNVVVKPFAYIEGDVEIGDGTVIASSAQIMNGARIGKDCEIHAGAVVSGIPQDLKFDGETTLCVIGDRTTVRECATINRGTKAKGITKIGNDCLIMAYAHVAHDCIVGDRVILVNNTSVAGEVEIGDWAILAGHVAVHQFVRIGKHVMIAGGSLVGKDVPSYVMAGQAPIQYMGLNVVGLRRRGFTSEQIGRIQDIYRVLLQSGMNTSNALEEIEKSLPHCEFRDEIIDFVKKSSRGIIRQYVGKEA